MKSIVIAVILSLAGVAAADEVPIPGTPPAGWIASPEHAELVRAGIAGGLPPEVQAADVRVYSYSAPKRGMGQLMFSVVGVPAGDEKAAAAYVRGRVEELHQTTKLMEEAGGKVKELSWQEHTDETGRVVDAVLEWAHLDNGTYIMVRAAWVKVAGKPDLVSETRAECALAQEAVELLSPVCGEALQSMLLPEAAARLPLMPVAGAAGPDVTKDAPPGVTETPPGTQVPMKPVVEPTPKNDWRPFYVIGALIVLGGVFLWNKKRREEYDAEDQKKEEAAAEKDEKGEKDEKEEEEEEEDEEDKEDKADE